VAKSKYYVVWVGHQTGIFTDWATCSKQVRGAAGSGPVVVNSARGKSKTTSNTSVTASSTRPAINKSANPNYVKTWTADEIATLSDDTLIYTDGGCEPNPGEAGSGIAIYRDGKLSQLWYGLYNPNGTNNTAELNALHQALLIAKEEIAKNRTVSILCDSKYSIQCVTQWAANWQKKGWTKNGGEIKNLEVIKKMYALHQTIKDTVNVRHVNGHVGVEGNELADRMSIFAMEQHNSDFSLYPNKVNIDEILALRPG